MAAGTYDFTWDQGDTFDITLTWRDQNEMPIDLSTYTARMQLRTSVDAVASTLELTTENGRISLGGPAGTVHLLIGAADMASLPAATYKYDLEMVSAGGTYVRKILKGKFKVVAEVTR